MKQKIQNIELAFLTADDYQELKQAMIIADQSMPDSYWEEIEIQALLGKFPEGQIVIKVNGHIAGCALSIIIDHEQFEERHTYKKITGNYSFSTHIPGGDTLYGIDVFIKPEFRGLRLGRRLYEYRKELCEKLNLKSIVFGGRIPNYHKYEAELSPKQYIEKVKSREIHDPVLNFQLSNDFYPVRILKGYLEGDKVSNEYAVLMR
jgi:GNAT superfamily N-acetyltransferase